MEEMYDGGTLTVNREEVDEGGYTDCQYGRNV